MKKTNRDKIIERAKNVLTIDKFYSLELTKKLLATDICNTLSSFMQVADNDVKIDFALTDDNLYDINIVAKAHMFYDVGKTAE